jgi:hypothetical protein
MVNFIKVTGKMVNLMAVNFTTKFYNGVVNNGRIGDSSIRQHSCL